jgi:photosystem II stability/assembly factor-like uncharacterized protein
VACYQNIYDVSMLNAQEGWAVGHDGVVLRYTTTPGNTLPTWQQVYGNWSEDFFIKILVVNSDEWWAIQGLSLVHYQDGEIGRMSLAALGVTNLLDLAVAGPDEVWVVGNEGILIHYHQGELTTVEVPQSYRLHAIEMLTAEEGWAAGSTLVHYRDGKWEEVPLSPVGGAFIGLDFERAGDDLWLGGSNSLFHYHNGEWQELPEVTGGETAVVEISMISETEGWAITSPPGLLHYRKGQWERVDSPTENTLRAIEMVNAEVGWVVGDSSTVLHYLDGSWQIVSESEQPRLLTDIDWVEDEGWAVGAAETILHYQDGNWQRQDNPLDSSLNIKLNGIDMISKTEGWAVGWQGTVLRYVEGRWQLVPTAFNQDLEDVDFVSDTEGWIVGEDGLIIHIVDEQWFKVDSPTNQRLKVIDMVDEQEGWVLGLDGTLLHYQNGVWQVVEPIVEQNYQLKMINKDNGWIIGSQGGESVILRYDGASWQPVEHPQGYSLSAMDMLNNEEGRIIAKEGMLHYQAGEWNIVDNPARAGMGKLIMLNENEGWAVGIAGILHYTNE